MKRILLSGLLAGMATTTSYGQGGIIIGNYQAPYNAITWFAGSPGGPTPVHSTDGVALTLFFGEGVLSANQLTSSIPLNWDLVDEANGYAGYYQNTSVVLPTWQAGDTFTFQIRAAWIFAGTTYPDAGRSVLWQENVNINFIGGTPPGVPGRSSESIGLTTVIPEPTTFAIAGLGFAGFILFRRRN